MFILAISLATKSFLLFKKKCDYPGNGSKVKPKSNPGYFQVKKSGKTQETLLLPDEQITQDSQVKHPTLPEK